MDEENNEANTDSNEKTNYIQETLLLASLKRDKEIILLLNAVLLDITDPSTLRTAVPELLDTREKSFCAAPSVKSAEFIPACRGPRVVWTSELDFTVTPGHCNVTVRSWDRGGLGVGGNRYDMMPGRVNTWGTAEIAITCPAPSMGVGGRSPCNNPWMHVIGQWERRGGEGNNIGKFLNGGVGGCGGRGSTQLGTPDGSSQSHHGDPLSHTMVIIVDTPWGSSQSNHGDPLSHTMGILSVTPWGSSQSHHGDHRRHTMGILSVTPW
ncbi:hypothetical protein Btru_070602 [Bulinus truncatus]|nr:hypothetical protein Btru_070602 [Bulinus truncatus]